MPKPKAARRKKLSPIFNTNEGSEPENKDRAFSLPEDEQRHPLFNRLDVLHRQNIIGAIAPRRVHNCLVTLVFADERAGNRA